MTEPNTNNVPEQISYTDQDRDAMSRFPILKEGWMRVMITEAKRGASKNNHLFVRSKLTPLTEDNQPGTKTTAQHDVYIPISNPSVPGHKAPRTGLGCYFFARALDTGFPQYARKSDIKGTWISPNGEKINKDTRDQIVREVDSAILKAATGWYNSPQTLKEEVFFVKIKHTVADNGNTYANVEETRAELPAGEVLIQDNFTE